MRVIVKSVTQQENRKQRENIILPRHEAGGEEGVIFLNSSGTGFRLPYGILNTNILLPLNMDSVAFNSKISATKSNYEKLHK